MEIIIPDSPKTQLTNRVLWYDGDSTIDEEHLMRMITCGNSTAGMFVDEITDEIAKYNRSIGNKEQKLGIKKELKPLTQDWIIPDEYKEINIELYVVGKLLKATEGMSDGDYSERVGRCLDELDMYKKLELMDVLRTLIFVINTFIENKIVWGVGRGSSVSSYVLYLMGVHDVDSFKYGLNIEEFLRTE